jgi:membrane protease YdiL (CAAX protease family)
VKKMSEPSQQAPAFLRPARTVFPGPFAALGLTALGLLATGMVAQTLALADLHFIAAGGIGVALGLGSVATVAAMRVPEPQRERIGLMSFERSLILPLLALLPSVILISEIDNWHRIYFPPSPETLALLDELRDLTRIDSVFALMQTIVVAVGISPVVEGFFFFGVLLQGLVAHLGRAGGVLLAAVLYSIVHFPASGTPADAVVPLASSLLIALLLGLARLGTGSVLAPMLLGAVIAALHLTAHQLRESLPITGWNAPGDHTPAIIVVPCALAAPIRLPIPEREDDDTDGFHF